MNRHTQDRFSLATRSRWLVAALLLLLLSSCLPPVNYDPGPAPGTRNELVLATTTSPYDSGLLDAILPDFENKTGVRVRVLAVGSGQAMALGQAGDADVLLVHAPTQEEAFIAAGYAPSRHGVMVNDFVVLGPASDPAGVVATDSAVAALSAIAQAQSTFLSRGDDSGTHIKEQSLWEQAGINPEGDWYESAGQGMGSVLTIAEEKQAYTLSDRGTYLSRLALGLDLAILYEGDPQLVNPYSILPVTPDKEHDINYGAAIAFINWITSDEVQRMIGEYGVEEFGRPLFIPNAGAGS